MAYGEKYRFVCPCHNGDEFTISIAKQGYTGEVIPRSLGRSPVLRRERSGHICGSSLEIYAECLVDREFAELYTSDPLEFKVTLVRGGGSTLFEGYVTPELYAEPDIAPPYDVQIIATDGLGELKRYAWTAHGRITLLSALETLLGYTGLDYDIVSNNVSLIPFTVSGANSGAYYLSDVYVDLDGFVGRSCYEMLDSIMESLHGVIFQRVPKWQIMHECDIEDSTWYTVEVRPTGTTEKHTTTYGSASLWEWWPVGQLESRAVPACRHLEITADAVYKEGLRNASMTSDSVWTSVNGATFDRGLVAYKFASSGRGISQSLTFQDYVRTALHLTVKLRHYVAAAGSAVGAGNAKIIVSMTGRGIGSYESDSTFYLAYDPDTEKCHWVTRYTEITKEIRAGAYGEGRDDCESLDFDLPLQLVQYSRNNYYAKEIYITIKSASSYPMLAQGASLTVAGQISGYRDSLTIDNGAREKAEAVESLLLPEVQWHYRTPQDFVYGMPCYQSGGSYVGIDWFDTVAELYARSCATVRVRRTGTVNVPEAGEIPMVFRHDNESWIVETYEWSLLDAEMGVSVITLPAPSVTVEASEVVETTQPSAGGSSLGGGSSTSQEAAAVIVDTALSSTSTNPVENRAVHAALRDKQASLVSGANIRTVGGQSLLGPGDVPLRTVMTVTKSGTAYTSDMTFAQARGHFEAGRALVAVVEDTPSPDDWMTLPLVTMKDESCYFSAVDDQKRLWVLTLSRDGTHTADYAVTVRTYDLGDGGGSSVVYAELFEDMDGNIRCTKSFAELRQMYLDGQYVVLNFYGGVATLDSSDDYAMAFSSMYYGIYITSIYITSDDDIFIEEITSLRANFVEVTYDPQTGKYDLDGSQDYLALADRVATEDFIQLRIFRDDGATLRLYASKSMMQTDPDNIVIVFSTVDCEIVNGVPTHKLISLVFNNSSSADLIETTM